MLPASNRGIGMSLNFPDVCKTPAPPAPFIPVPYPDIGLNMQAAPFSPFVFIAFMPATNMGTLKVMTSGDEAGALGGLITGMIKGPGKTTIGNPIVFVTGLPAESLLNPTSGNMMNAPVGAQIVPSVVNVLYTYREAPGGFESPDAPTVESGDPCLFAPLRGEDVRALRDVACGEGSAEEAARVSCAWLVPGIARLRIGLFSTRTDLDVFNALRALGDDAIRGLVIDLRGNPGGDAGAALRLAAACLPAGTTMLSQRDGDDDEPVIARGTQTYRFPLCLLVDGGTASAAELLTAALQQAGRAIVVGQCSFGKTTGQQIVGGADGAPRYVTTSAFTLPGGALIDGRGVTPDVIVALELHEGVDPAEACDASTRAALTVLSLPSRMVEPVGVAGMAAATAGPA